ncbi:MAG: hypothetical protein HWD84_11025 [Flavobacteriaceae bacterium]|nr:hypothetical protein [Flavobacteriaceae bacterium]
MKKKIITSATLLFCFPALAMVFGGSNFTLGSYPKNTCYPPTSKPFKPYQFNNQFEIDSYNVQVKRYNAELEDYSNCIDEYIENANNDIKRIQEAAQQAINEFNNL